MANRHVVPHNGKWADRAEGASRVGGIYDTQAQAFDAGRARVINSGGGELRIHGENGKIRDSNTYGKVDPYPPKG